MAEENLILRMRAHGARTAARDVDATTKAVQRSGAAAAKSGRQARSAGSKWQGMTTRMKVAGHGVRSAGEGLTRLTAPIALVTGVSAKLAIDFDSAMSKIQGLVGISRKQTNEWGQELIELGRHGPHDATELADALFFVASAGFRGNEAMEVLEMSSKAAAAGLGETKTVADAVTSAVNAYHGTGLKASGVTDALVAAVRAGKMPVDALAGAIGAVIPVAAELGVSFDEVVGTAAAMSRVGAPVNRTMTGMRYLLASLANPASKVSKILGTIGLSADDVRKSIADKGLLKTLEMLHDRLPIQDFLKTVGGARGVVTALGLVGRNSKQVNKVMKDVRNSTGATEKAYNVAAKTAKFKLATAMSSLQSSGIELGHAILPTLVPILMSIAHGLSAVAQWFKRLNPETKKTIVIIALVVAVLGPLLTMLGMMAIAVTALASPVALVVIGVLALAAGFVYAYTKFKWFRDIANTVWDVMRHSPMAYLIKTWISLLKIFFGVIKKMPGAIKSGFIAVVNFLIDRVNNVIDVINALIRAFNKLPGPDIGEVGKLQHIGESNRTPWDKTPKLLQPANPLTPPTLGQTFAGAPQASGPAAPTKRQPRRAPRRNPLNPGGPFSPIGAGASAGDVNLEDHITVEIDGEKVGKKIHRRSIKAKALR